MHKLFRLYTRAIGNLAIKILWTHFIKKKVYSLEIERKDEAIFFEELCGTQEIAEFYDPVNSPPSKTTATVCEVILGSATKTIQSPLNPIQSLTLLSKGIFSRGFSMQGFKPFDG